MKEFKDNSCVCGSVELEPVCEPDKIFELYVEFVRHNGDNWDYTAGFIMEHILNKGCGIDIDGNHYSLTGGEYVNIQFSISGRLLINIMEFGTDIVKCQGQINHGDLVLYGNDTISIIETL